MITGFHSETTESEFMQLLKELINEVGMDFGNARIECTAKPITRAFIHFIIDGERNKFIRSANMLKKELRGTKIKITRSMDAEERFHNKRMEYVKYCIHTRHNILLSLISLNWTSKYVSVKGQIVVKTCQSASSSSSNTRMLKTKSKNKCKNGKQKTHLRREEGRTTSSQKTIFTTEKTRRRARDKLMNVDDGLPTCRRNSRNNNDDETKRMEDLRGKG